MAELKPPVDLVIDHIKAVPTVYAGVQFRSRLEARWAAFFDGLGWKWMYEPAELNGWIPDFRLELCAPVWVEVKPEYSIEDLEQYTSKLDEAGCNEEILLVGATPLLKSKFYDDALGLLRESPDFGWLKQWDEALWMGCVWLDETLKNTCGKVGFYHSIGSFRGRVCGHHDGDHHLGGLPDGLIERLWNDAGNVTQWRGIQKGRRLSKLECSQERIYG